MNRRPLFPTETHAFGAAEVPPDLWAAAEAFVSGSLPERRDGLAGLTAAGPAGYTCLHLHLFASRLAEPDLPLRHAILNALGAALDRRGGAYLVSPGLRDYLRGLLADFGPVELEWVIQAVAAVTGAHSGVLRLLSYVPGAGKHLARLAGDVRKESKVRATAARMIGEVGYVDATPALDGLEARLEGKRAGQLAMAFAPRDDPAADVVLPAVKAALEALRDVD